MAKQTRLLQRKNKHQRVRKKLKGTPERPRLAVFRSLKYIYAQIIDDYAGNTLIAVSSLKGFSEGSKDTLSIAKEIGKQIGQLAVQKNIKKVVFDRSGYLYHGRVKALADGAREAGLEF